MEPVGGNLCDYSKYFVSFLSITLKGLLNIFYNYITHQISHVNGKPYALQFFCYLVSSFTAASYLYSTKQSFSLPSIHELGNLSISAFACMVAMFYLHSLSNRSVSERLTNRVGYHSSLLTAILLETMQRQFTVRIGCGFDE